ncbi:hypothetical protein HHL28_12605 [Aerophototrophica crusticola]|uniref:SAM-dependent methyltransferase n=1 Tax=Aerophototrophica crusticola TaxID=1709002 RepID=A0A858R9G9_9PROT|nr:hypothetical protein HHL28_12605 [Rhodospirillaceae bacterium B3]
MLWELWASLRTDCPPDLRRLGYRYGAVACLARARRCAKAWAPHQERTKAAIHAALAWAGPGDTAIVLGSGPCLDLPVPALLARFPKLVLVDAAHPPPAKALARRHPGIELVSLDLTGTAAGLLDPDAPAPPRPGCTALLDRPGVGLVVSANLLSQLPLLPVAAASARWPGLEGDRFARAVVEAHLAHLRAFNCPALLVTDVRRRAYGHDGALLSDEDPLAGLALPPGEEWDWDMAPRGELPGGKQLVTRVRAVRVG